MMCETCYTMAAWLTAAAFLLVLGLWCAKRQGWIDTRELDEQLQDAFYGVREGRYDGN